MKTTTSLLLAGFAAAMPILAGAEPPGASAPPALPVAAANDNASADTINKIIIELQSAAAAATTNSANADALKNLKLKLQQVLAQTAADPPEPPQQKNPAAAPNSSTAAFTVSPTSQATLTYQWSNGTNSTSTANAAASANETNSSNIADNGTNGLRMNFRGAPLDLVLDYMINAAGFIVNKETEVRGTVDVMSKGPVTKDEAVELLYSALKKNNYSLIRSGRILTIVDAEGAKNRTPIEAYKYPNTVENSDEVVTEIIPVRYANVTQLINNLQILLPTSATLSANESANSLILVATKTDVRRMLEIITALDTSIASVSSIRVFLLRYEDAKDLATLVTQLFSAQSSNQGSGGGGGGFRGNLFNMFRGGGGPGGFGGGPGGGGGGGGGATAAGGGATAAHVTAVGDDRSNALIVSAPLDLLNTIAEMVDKIDQPVADITELKVFTLKYADPSDVASELGSLYPDDTNSGNANQGPFPFFFRGGPGGGGQQRGGASSTSDEHARKMGRVLAVAEPRTKKLMVTAPKMLMPQIADMIAELDVRGQQEIVGVYDIQNADPQDVQQALTDLFNRNSVRMSSSANSSSSMLGQGNPLRQRETQQQQNLNTSSTLGTSGGGGAGRGTIP
jgi:type II secretory pathway component GspD/PulD (secretin)